MFRKVLSFITRRDGAYKNRASRRLRSPRASVFLEYAIVLPLAVLLISTMIEFAAYWDAKIMANHTAWTCARIASVKAGQEKKYVDLPGPDRLRTTGMETATTLLMSTCAMGSMHGSSSDFGKHWFEELIRKPLNQLRDAVKQQLSAKLTKFLTDAIGKYVGKDVISQLVKEAVGWIAKRLFDPLIQKIVEVLDKLFEPMFRQFGELLDGNRQLRQLAYAVGRLKEVKNVITVTERMDTPFIFSKQPTIMSVGDWRLDFPRVLDSKATADKWMVKSDSPWPPNDQRQRMIDVTIRWPFERAWMFPVLSSAKLSTEDAQKLEGRPTAVGRAMAYPQPIICNDNLKSTGAEPYDPGNTNAVPDVVKKIKDKFIGFLKIAALYYHYQQNNEEIGPFDSKDGGSRTYKGIGLGISGEPDKKKYYTPDGLVFWMDRAPADYGSQNAWKRKPRPPDYFECWKEVAETDNEKCIFWRGIPFHPWTILSKYLDRFCNHDYWRKEWFFWGDGKNRHLRIKHKKPSTVYGEIDIAANRPCFVFPEDTVRTASRTVSKNEFEARVPPGERAYVTYDRYGKVMAKDAGSCLLRSHIRALVGAWCVPATAGKVLKEEPEIFGQIKGKLELKNNETWTLIVDCSRELDAAVGGGGGGGGTGDPGKLIDFGGTDEEIMKDPQKAAEILEKKLNALKPKVYAAVRRVDAAERKLRDLDNARPGKVEEWRRLRESVLIDFAVAISRASFKCGSEDPASVKVALQQEGWPGQPVLDVLAKMQAHYDEYADAVYEYYNAEVELGKLLNCKAAKDKPPLRPTDPDPGLKPPKDPDRPNIPSPESGPDDDWGGDSWSKGPDGWRKDGKDPWDI